MIEAIVRSILTFIFGLIISRVFYGVLKFFLEDIVGLERFLEKKKVKSAIFNMNLSNAISILVSTYIFLFFLKYSLGYIGILYDEVIAMINNFPLLIYLFVIIILSLLFSEGVKLFVENSRYPFSKEEATIAKYISFFVLFSIGLELINIRIEIINFTIKLTIASILFAFSLAFGIGFGLALSEELKKGRRK